MRSNQNDTKYTFVIFIIKKNDTFCTKLLSLSLKHTATSYYTLR